VRYLLEPLTSPVMREIAYSKPVNTLLPLSFFCCEDLGFNLGFCGKRKPPFSMIDDLN